MSNKKDWIVVTVLLIILVGISSILFIFQWRNKKQSVEKFDDGNCQYQADVGLVCPLRKETKLYKIVPYQDTDKHVQEDVVHHLRKEWGSEYSHDYIMRHWPTGGDIMYVMTNVKGTEFF